MRYLVGHRLAAFLASTLFLFNIAAMRPLADTIHQYVSLPTTGILLFLLAGFLYVDGMLASRWMLVPIALLFAWPPSISETGLLAVPYFFFFRPPFSPKTRQWDRRSISVCVVMAVTVLLYFLANKVWLGRWVITRHHEYVYQIPPLLWACHVMVSTLLYPARWTWPSSVPQTMESVIYYWLPWVVFLILLLSCKCRNRYYIVASLIVIVFNCVGMSVKMQTHSMYTSLPAFCLIWCVLLKEALAPTEPTAQDGEEKSQGAAFSRVLPVGLCLAFVLSGHIETTLKMLPSFATTGAIHRNFFTQLAKTVTKEEIRTLGTKDQDGRRSVSVTLVVAPEARLLFYPPPAMPFSFEIVYGKDCRYPFELGWPKAPDDILKYDIALFWDNKALGYRIPWPDVATEVVEGSGQAVGWLEVKQRTSRGNPIARTLEYRNPPPAPPSSGQTSETIRISYQWQPVDGKVRFLVRWKNVSKTGQAALADMRTSRLSFLDARGNRLSMLEPETRDADKPGEWNEIWFPRGGAYVDPATLPAKPARAALELAVKPPPSQGVPKGGSLLLENPICILHKRAAEAN
ncbi:hypothetical protein FJY63_03655 [Candidatus Sumerlaeota bacterium]|nr:hypothetical protein [Candidatus Sumerlaeota bacterium]